MDISGILEKTGLSLPDAMNGLTKVIKFIPTAKSYLPKIKEIEKLFNIKEGEKVIYSIMPVIPKYTGEETEEEKAKLDSFCELKISVLVIKQDEKGNTLIDREAATFKAFEEIEKISNLFPV